MINSTYSSSPPGPPIRFVIGASFTAEPLKPVIEFWGSQLGASFDIRFAPYNQLEQALLDPGGEFSAADGGVNVIAIRIEDFGGFELARIRSNIEHFLRSLEPAEVFDP